MRRGEPTRDDQRKKTRLLTTESEHPKEQEQAFLLWQGIHLSVASAHACCTGMQFRLWQPPLLRQRELVTLKNWISRPFIYPCPAKNICLSQLARCAKECRRLSSRRSLLLCQAKYQVVDLNQFMHCKIKKRLNFSKKIYFL